MVNLSKMSESLKELMAERDLTQVALADQLGTGRTKLSDILNAKNAPGYKTFIALIEYFHCSADFLLGLREYPCEEIHYQPVRPFGERLREILQETGTTQYRFTKEADVSWGVFYNWLTGKSFPSVDNLVKIAGYFGCSVDFLLGRV